MRQTEDAFHPLAPHGTRDAGAWFEAGLADGKVRRWERQPVWAEPEIRQAWLDGYWMGRQEVEG